jgi:hypothetical protein
MATGGTSYDPNRRRKPGQQADLAGALRASGGQGSGKAVSSNFQPKLGRQLSRRVSSGAITQKQAQRTVGQRSVLARAYGDDWREKVYGASGRMLRVRKQLAANPGNSNLRAEHERLLRRRRVMLEKARAKLSEGGS